MNYDLKYIGESKSVRPRTICSLDLLSTMSIRPVEPSEVVSLVLTLVSVPDILISGSFITVPVPLV